MSAVSIENDPDETEGRRLYRQRADSLVRVEMSLARRRVALRKLEEPETPTILSVAQYAAMLKYTACN